MPGFKEWLTGKKDKIKKAKTVTKEQEEIQALIQEGLEKGTGPFADIFGAFNEEEFNKGISEPALKNFRENILPQLQEKFIAGNQVLGSGLQRAQTQAAGDLQSQLAQLMYGAQQNKQTQRQQGLENLLGQRNFENIYQQGTTGALQKFGNELVTGAAKSITSGGGLFGGGGGGGAGGGNAGSGVLRAAQNFVA
jgi:hypothetical protein